ncbi:glycosyltransferase family 2 protein [Isosphaeraceae bacterium EP7]
MIERSSPRLSVVIPTYNGRALLERCLASLDQHSPPGVEILVIDDASTDGTAEWISAIHPAVRLLRMEKNGGFCTTANAGLAAAKGEFVQLLNNDTEVTEGWYEAALRPFENPAVGSVAPLVLVLSEPDRVDSAGDSYAFFGWPTKRGHGESAAEWAVRPADRVFGASGAAAIYRASALRRSGLLDPSFGSYYEDVDLAFRLRWAGYECEFAPSCRILHAISATFDHARPGLQRQMARNAELVYWANLTRTWLAISVVPHAGFVMAQGLARLMRGRFGPFWRGKCDALSLLGRDLAGRRRLRTDLARSAVHRPNFPLRVNPLGDVRNHIGRPAETNQGLASRSD